MTDKPVFSVIFGTYNRLKLLQECVASVRQAVADLSCEIVITDGGSTDGSLEWMAQQKDIVIAQTGNLRGAVSAFNVAWAASRGEYIANFNDDTIYVGQALACALQELQADAGIGQIALEFNVGFGLGWHHKKLPTAASLVYANYGLGHRSIVEKVCCKQGGPNHYWNPIYHTYAADCEHSAWIWALGYRVQASKQCVVDRHVDDMLRRKNERLCATVRHDDKLFCD